LALRTVESYLQERARVSDSQITPRGGPGGALAAFDVVAGPRAGEEVPVRLPVVHIGSGAQNEIVLPDDSISAVHARLEYDDGGWRLTDLGSTNGTFVEGVRLTPEVPTPLAYGSAVRLGGVRLGFHEVEAADPGAARAGYEPPPAAKRLTEERRGFRLPVWLVVVLLVLIAVAIYLAWVWTSPAPVAPVPASGTALLVAAPPGAP
jgi:pSer/pThr/pTyr-binding forkhead associated (FHA) protein